MRFCKDCKWVLPPKDDPNVANWSHDERYLFHFCIYPEALHPVTGSYLKKCIDERTTGDCKKGGVNFEARDK